MILAGCDNPKSLESFTPEMASFSNEFDFDPLRGPVKDFSQTLMSENGLDANYYRDAQTLEKKVQLQGKCQLAALPSAGVTWETDDNGFVVSATGKEMKVEYRYDSEGYPLGKTTINSQNTLSVTAKPSADPRKKLDYTAVSRVDDRQVGNVTQSCEYDAYANPVDCRLVIVDESVKPAVSHHYTIKNRIDYY